MIKQSGRPFLTEHNGIKAAVLENDILRVVILPGRGGKTVSILHKPIGFELLAQTNREYPPLMPGMDFSNGDASGFDDAFPSIDGETVLVDGKAVVYPDHGEVWTMPMEVILREESILLTGQSGILPYSYQKKVWLSGDKVCYDYTITHTGGGPFPCLWVCHGLMRYEPDMRLTYPNGMAIAQNVFAGPDLGQIGERHPLTGGMYDFSTVPPKESNTMVKYYLQGQCPQGSCGISYPTQGVACELEFDHLKLPYLGFWLTTGGYRGEYNCAFEPATGYYDSVSRAMENGTAVILSPMQTLTFFISYRLFELSAKEQPSFMEGRL